MTRFALFALLLTACGTPSAPPTVAPTKAPNAPLTWPSFARLDRLEMPIVDDHTISDTLLSQVTFGLPDGSFLMVAGPEDEARDDGLRLYHYRLLNDTTAQYLAYSGPAYDSYTMLPTFFGDAASKHGPWLLLANFGEKDSWGQKVMVLDQDGFHDLGFVDAAVPERRPQADTVFLRLANIAPHIIARQHGDSVFLDLGADTVHLYDDLQGHRDTLRSGASTGYVIVRNGGFLLRDGQRLLPVSPPA